MTGEKRGPKVEANWSVTLQALERHSTSVRTVNFSPDGKQIAFQTANGKEFYFYLNSKIAVVSADGGMPRLLSDAFDEDPALVVWNADGIYFAADIVKRIPRVQVIFIQSLFFQNTFSVVKNADIGKPRDRFYAVIGKSAGRPNLGKIFFIFLVCLDFISYVFQNTEVIKR